MSFIFFFFLFVWYESSDLFSVLSSWRRPTQAESLKNKVIKGSFSNAIYSHKLKNVIRGKWKALRPCHEFTTTTKSSTKSPSSQFVPVHGDGQLHWYPEAVTTQLPPFTHDNNVEIMQVKSYLHWFVIIYYEIINSSLLQLFILCVFT